MKRFYAIAVFLVFAFACRAQQDPLFAPYLFNPLVINPAYTGMTNNLNLSTGFRKQWAGFDGSPTTFNLTGHIALLNNKMGAGLIVLQDQVGSDKTTEVHGTYAYKLPIDANTELSFGLQAGVISYRQDNSELNPYDPTDPAFTGTQSITKPSFGFGVILKTDRLFAGISVPRMLKTKTVFQDVESTLYTQHFYATAAYIIFVSDRIRIKPSILLKGVKGSPLSVDYNGIVNIDEKYMAGLSIRNFNTYGLLLGMRLADKLRLGYVFEVPTNKSVGDQFTTHELTLGLNLAVLPSHETILSNF